MTLSNDLYQHPKLITVFGGSGFVGRHVVEELTKRGYRVRIAIRRPEIAYYMLQIGEVGQTQMQKTNVRNRESVARALIDADAAIFLPGVLYNSGKNTFNAVQVEGAKNVAELAKSANIPLIHMSSLQAGSDIPIDYAKTKAQGEAIVQATHKDAIIVRPSVIFGPEDNFFNKFADLSRFSWFLPMFGGGKTKLQPVYVGDVAEFIVRALEGKVPSGKIYELGGKEVMTFRETMQEMLKVIMRKKILLPVPFPIGTLIGGWLGFWGKIPLIPMIATAGQVKMLKYDCVVSEEAKKEKRTLEGVGIEPKAMEAILQSYLWRFRPAGQFATIDKIYKEKVEL